MNLKDVLELLKTVADIAMVRNWEKFVAGMLAAGFYDPEKDTFGWQSSGPMEFVNDLRAFLRKASQCAKAAKKA